MAKYQPTDLERAEKLSLKILVFLFALGFLVLLMSYIRIEEIPFKEYSFIVNVDGSQQYLHYIQLEDFQIYYNFDTEEGLITFDLSGTNYTESVYVSLPNELEVSAFTWIADCIRGHGSCTLYEKGFDYRMTINNNTAIVNLFNNTLKKSNSHINFSFTGKLYPNSEIEINLANNGVRIIPPTGEGDGAFFIYDLGDKYQCYDQDCVRAYRDWELKFDEFQNKKRVKVPKDNLNNWRDINYELFYLNYDFNKDARNLSFLLILVGNILVGGTLAGFVLYIVYWYLKRKRKK